MVSTPEYEERPVRTLNLVIGAFLAVPNIDYTKKRLVDGETLSKGAELLGMTNHADRCEFLCKLIKADVYVYHNRPIAGVVVEQGKVSTNRMLQPGSRLRATIVPSSL